MATGKGKQAAKTELEKLQLHKEPCAVSSDDAVKHIAKILVMLHQENKDNQGKKLEMELSWICAKSDYKHQPVPKDVIAAATTWAQEQLDEEEEDDDEDQQMQEG